MANKGHKGYPQAKKSLPTLHRAMKARKLTNEELAKIAMVSTRTVSEARRGGMVTVYMADCINNTLKELK